MLVFTTIANTIYELLSYLVLEGDGMGVLHAL